MGVSGKDGVTLLKSHLPHLQAAQNLEECHTLGTGKGT